VSWIEETKVTVDPRKNVTFTSISKISSHGKGARPEPEGRIVLIGRSEFWPRKRGATPRKGMSPEKEN